MAMVLSSERTAVKSLPESPLTYEQFLDWADEDTYVEWVDGEIELMSPASAVHQDISVFLTRLFAEYAEEYDAGKVLTAPFQMKLSALRRGREPDLLFLRKPTLSLLRGSFLDGPADLVVEIISPESLQRDRDTKYHEYEAGGVREYWIIDAEAQRADFFVRDAAGRYQSVLPEGNGKYRSAVLPSFWLQVAWLWQMPLPPLRQVLQEWAEAADA
jgi:Uma2 family endonuclease